MKATVPNSVRIMSEMITWPMYRVILWLLVFITNHGKATSIDVNLRISLNDSFGFPTAFVYFGGTINFHCSVSADCGTESLLFTVTTKAKVTLKEAKSCTSTAATVFSLPIDDRFTLGTYACEVAGQASNDVTVSYRFCGLHDDTCRSETDCKGSRGRFCVISASPNKVCLDASSVSGTIGMLPLVKNFTKCSDTSQSLDGGHLRSYQTPGTALYGNNCQKMSSSSESMSYNTFPRLIFNNSQLAFDESFVYEKELLGLECAGKRVYRCTYSRSRTESHSDEKGRVCETSALVTLPPVIYFPGVVKIFCEVEAITGSNIDENMGPMLLTAIAVVFPKFVTLDKNSRDCNYTGSSMFTLNTWLSTADGNGTKQYKTDESVPVGNYYCNARVYYQSCAPHQYFVKEIKTEISYKMEGYGLSKPSTLELLLASPMYIGIAAGAVSVLLIIIALAYAKYRIKSARTKRKLSLDLRKLCEIRSKSVRSTKPLTVKDRRKMILFISDCLKGCTREVLHFEEADDTLRSIAEINEMIKRLNNMTEIEQVQLFEHYVLTTRKEDLNLAHDVIVKIPQAYNADFSVRMDTQLTTPSMPGVDGLHINVMKDNVGLAMLVGQPPGKLQHEALFCGLHKHEVGTIVWIGDFTQEKHANHLAAYCSMKVGDTETIGKYTITTTRRFFLSGFLRVVCLLTKAPEERNLEITIYNLLFWPNPKNKIDYPLQLARLFEILFTIQLSHLRKMRFGYPAILIQCLTGIHQSVSFAVMYISSRMWMRDSEVSVYQSFRYVHKHRYNSWFLSSDAFVNELKLVYDILAMAANALEKAQKQRSQLVVTRDNWYKYFETVNEYLGEESLKLPGDQTGNGKGKRKDSDSERSMSSLEKKSKKSTKSKKSKSSKSSKGSKKSKKSKNKSNRKSASESDPAKRKKRAKSATVTYKSRYLKDEAEELTDNTL